jgi:hypothetical protein
MVLVTVGGGEDGGQIIDAFIDMIRDHHAAETYILEGLDHQVHIHVAVVEESLHEVRKGRVKGIMALVNVS